MSPVPKPKQLGGQMLRTPARWRSAPIPDGFGDIPFAGPDGQIMLPLRLDWTPAGGITRDLQDPGDRRLVYEIILTEGTAQGVQTYINPVLLLQEWDDLVLPDAVIVMWQPWITSQYTK